MKREGVCEVCGAVGESEGVMWPTWGRKACPPCRDVTGFVELCAGCIGDAEEALQAWFDIRTKRASIRFLRWGQRWKPKE